MKKLITIKTEHGEFVVSYMNDRVSDCVEIIYHDKNNNESGVVVDVLKDTDEARALTYPVDCDEPTEFIILNRR